MTIARSRLFLPVLGCAMALLASPDAWSQKPAEAPAPQDEAKPVPPESVEQVAEAEEPVKAKIHLVRLAGSYADQASSAAGLESLLLGGGGKSKSAPELVRMLQGLAANDEAQLVLFDLTKSVSIDLANLPEVVDAMREIRKSGKRMFAYLKSAGSIQYQLAAQCGRIYMAEMGILDLPSLGLSTLHMKEAFDRFGIGMDVVRCGDFKGAVEPYLLPKMSAHLRAHYMAMLKTMNDGVVERIAEGRELDPGWVRAMQKKRLFTADQAKAEGLVDALVPWRDAVPTLASALELGEDYETVDVLKKNRKQPVLNPMLMFSKLFQKQRPKRIRQATIAVLHLEGTIVDGDKAQPGSIVSGPMVEEIQRLRGSDKVKAVVVRVNSPGGSATASEAILVALKELAAEKPMVVSMGRLAASGGYWVSCTGTRVYAQPGTITGSIGVFGTKPNLAGLMDDLGLHESRVDLDDSVGMDSLFRAWRPEEKERIQSFVNSIYDRFLDKVAAVRKMPRSVVERLAGGRVWSGMQAKKNGLVDELGGLGAALADVRKQAKLAADVPVTHLPKPKSFFETLAESLGEVRAILPAARELRLVARQHASLEQALQILNDAVTHRRAWNVWALSPVTLQVR